MDYLKDEIEENEIEAANKRAAARLAKTPTALRARYDRRINCLVIDLSTGFSVTLKPHKVQGLEEAKPEQLTKIEISPSGFNIYFPDLDADLYLPGLLEGVFGSRRWMASHLGKTGGRSTSAAKTAASRSNGKLGGRPRKKSPVTDAAQRSDYTMVTKETIKSTTKKELTKARVNQDNSQNFSDILPVLRELIREEISPLSQRLTSLEESFNNISDSIRSIQIRPYREYVTSYAIMGSCQEPQSAKSSQIMPTIKDQLRESGQSKQLTHTGLGKTPHSGQFPSGQEPTR